MPRHALKRSRRRRVPALVLGLLGIAVAAAAVGPPLRANALRQAEAVFSVKCDVNHSAPDDPIVFPAQPGRSHLHDFFGNVSTNAATTTASLAGSRSDCLKGMGEIDHAAYWTPALLDGGKPVRGAPGELRVDAYYAVLDKPVPVQPMPFGLRMIAGDSKATSPQRTSVASFDCVRFPNGGEVTPRSATIPTCPSGSYLSGQVHFPGCWDGRNLDSADHKSHMAYPVRGSCPATHPVRLPSINLRIRWKMAQGTPSSQLTLSSGGQNSLHADFWNAWSPAAMQWLVVNCLNATRNCHDIARSQIPVPSGQFPSGDAQATAPASGGGAVTQTSAATSAASATVDERRLPRSDRCPPGSAGAGPTASGACALSIGSAIRTSIRR